jgi:uncharacterized delta-60 repeat protein
VDRLNSVFFRFFRLPNSLTNMQKPFYLLSIAFSFVSSVVFSQSGSLDSTFNEVGIVRTDVGIHTLDFLYAITIQPDQKIVAVGSVNVGGNLDFAVIRYLADGSIDSDFGINGLAQIDFNNGDDAGHAIVLQPDGKMVLAGTTQLNSLADFAVARLNPDGTPDSTFGVAGIVISDLGSDYDYPNAVALQTNGKIIVAGRYNYSGFTGSDFAMIRYKEDGEVDSTFGANGIVLTGIHEEDEVKGIIIQPDGKIVLGGFASISAKGDYAMVRYLDNGQVDKSFGIGGKVTTDLAGQGRSDYETCVLQDKDGMIVLGGSANYNTIEGTSELGIVRYDKDGHLDQGFALHGIYILHLGDNSQMQTILQQPDGKYLFAGKSDAVGFKNQWLLARVTNAGELDTSFGNQGYVATDMAGTYQVANAMALQIDSRIVVGGLNGDFANADFVLARYIADFTMTADITGLTCFGGNDASISLNVTGGVPPYEYSIDGINFQSSPVFPVLSAGNYTITVSDSNGNGVTGSYGPIHIENPPAPPAVQVDVTGNTITVTVDGAGQYLYSVNGGATFQSSNVFSGLPDGVYLVFVLDQNGCISYSDEVVVHATGVKGINDISFSISPNPCNDFISIQLDNNVTSLKAIIVDMAGRQMSNEVVYPDGSGKIQIIVNQLSSGRYTLWMKDGEKWGTASFVKQ